MMSSLERHSSQVLQEKTFLQKMIRLGDLAVYHSFPQMILVQCGRFWSIKIPHFSVIKEHTPPLSPLLTATCEQKASSSMRTE